MTRKKTHDEFVKEVFGLVGEDYSVLERYKLSNIKILMRHNVCGNVWSIRPNNFLSGKRCPKCAAFKTTDTFREKVNKLTNGNLAVIGEYINCDHSVLLKCNIHGNIFKSIPTSVLRGRRVCSKCNAEYLSKVQRKSTKDFYDELKNRHQGKIICVEEYVNTHTKIKFKCLVCNSEFNTEPNAILRISGCPSCAESKGESAIREYLIRNNINFVPQKTFPDCRSVRQLSFDFYVPSHNLLIEYNGKQHYTPIDFFGGIGAFKGQVKRDSIKKKYAERKGISLIQIPYTVIGDDIHKMLDNVFRAGNSKDSLK